MTYHPDNWVVLKIKGDDPHYRLLVGWSGGYTQGSSWRLNSGITNVQTDGDYLLFYGSSGSCYKCHKNMNEVKMNIAPTLAQLQKLHGDKVELMGEETDWLNMDWIIR